MKRPPPRRVSRWLASGSGSLAAAFATGLVLAVVVFFSRRALSERRGPGDDSVPGARDVDRGARSSAIEHYQEGRRLFEAEQYADALREFKAASRLDPADPRALTEMGETYRKFVFEDLAEQAFRRALAVDPNYLPAMQSLAKTLYDSGRHDEAVTLLEKALAANPDEPLLWAELAINSIRLGKPADAIPLLEKYNAVKGKQAWGYAHLGRAHAEAGHPQAAEEAYRAALAIDSHMAVAHFWLGQLLVGLGRKAEASASFDTYRGLRQLQTQEHTLRMALLSNPADLNALVNLARTRYLLGKTDEAMRAMERAVELAPDDQRLKQLHADLQRALAAPPQASNSSTAR